jgi:hypothetical protein
MMDFGEVQRCGVQASQIRGSFTGCVAAGSKRYAHVIADRDSRFLLEFRMVQTLLVADSQYSTLVVMRRGIT